MDDRANEVFTMRPSEWRAQAARLDEIADNARDPRDQETIETRHAANMIRLHLDIETKPGSDEPHTWEIHPNSARFIHLALNHQTAGA